MTISLKTKALASAAAACLLFLAPTQVQAACPTAKTVAKGFFLQGGSAKSEVRHIGDHFVQVTTRYPDGVVQADLYYDGLFAVSRSSSRGSTMMFNAKLADWSLDLTEGATSTVSYIPIVDSEPHPEATLELEVKGTETLKLGDCSFDVQVISQTKKSGQRSRQFDQLYAPLLKFVIARRYPNGDVRAYRGIEVMN